MKKIKCLITAGPTREHFDPVRYISNPSSGKMGWFIAQASKEFGWDTTLVLGPSALPNIDGVNVERVVSAEDMLSVCRKHFDDCHILIMSACLFADNYFKTAGIAYLPSQVLYPIIQGGCLITVNISASMFFGEKTTLKTVFGSAIALGGIVIMSIA